MNQHHRTVSIQVASLYDSHYRELKLLFNISELAHSKDSRRRTFSFHYSLSKVKQKKNETKHSAPAIDIQS